MPVHEEDRNPLPEYMRVAGFTRVFNPDTNTWELRYEQPPQAPIPSEIKVKLFNSSDIPKKEKKPDLEFVEPDRTSTDYLLWKSNLYNIWCRQLYIDPILPISNATKDLWIAFLKKKEIQHFSKEKMDGKKSFQTYILKGAQWNNRTLRKSNKFYEFYVNQDRFDCKQCSVSYLMSKSPKKHRGKMCRRCVVRYYTDKKCGNCSKKVRFDSLRRCTISKDNPKKKVNTSVCYECMDLKKSCRLCGAYFWHDHVKNNLKNVCVVCFEQDPRCLTCGHIMPEWIQMCEPCEVKNAIRPYNYDMDLIFHRSKKDLEKDPRFFGCELEITSAGGIGYKSGISWMAKFLKENQLGILKKDSTTGALGVEINFQPMTFHRTMEEVSKEGKIFKLIEEVKALGWLSHWCQLLDVKASCGMHVHLSLDSNAKALERSKIYRINRFIKTNHEWIRKIGQRTVDARNRFCDPSNSLSPYSTSRLKNWMGGETKHVPVNLQRSTMEFRLFSGTLVPSRFRKNVQFVDALYTFCSEYCSTDVRDLIDFIAKHQTRYKALHDYIVNNIDQKELELERVA